MLGLAMLYFQWSLVKIASLQFDPRVLQHTWVCFLISYVVLPMIFSQDRQFAVWSQSLATHLSVLSYSGP